LCFLDKDGKVNFQECKRNDEGYNEMPYANWEASQLSLMCKQVEAEAYTPLGVKAQVSADESKMCVRIRDNGEYCPIIRYKDYTSTNVRSAPNQCSTGVAEAQVLNAIKKATVEKLDEIKAAGLPPQALIRDTMSIITQPPSDAPALIITGDGEVITKEQAQIRAKASTNRVSPYQVQAEATRTRVKQAKRAKELQVKMEQEREAANARGERYVYTRSKLGEACLDNSQCAPKTGEIILCENNVCTSTGTRLISAAKDYDAILYGNLDAYAAEQAKTYDRYDAEEYYADSADHADASKYDAFNFSGRERAAASAGLGSTAVALAITSVMAVAAALFLNF
jgi:hypothetical protein